jgi:flagellar biosynthesis chaperone FliJ
MRPRTRLDPVIKIEEKKEERKLHEMAAAGRKVKSAEEALSSARQTAEADHRRPAAAQDWLLAEAAHTRALFEVRTAEHAMKSATVAEDTSRDAYRQAHSRAESLRRVAQARVDEIMAQRAKAEARELDDIGMLTFNANARAG